MLSVTSYLGSAQAEFKDIITMLCKRLSGSVVVLLLRGRDGNSQNFESLFIIFFYHNTQVVKNPSIF